jgi:hypothetical protein
MSRTNKQVNPTVNDKKYNFGDEIEKISSQGNSSFSTNTTRLYKKISAGLIKDTHFEEMTDALSNGISFGTTEDRIKTTRNKSTSVNMKIDFESPQSAQMAFDMLTGISQLKLRDIPLDLNLELKKTGSTSSISIKTSDALMLEEHNDNSDILQQREQLLKRNVTNSIAISALITGIYSPFRTGETNKLTKEDFGLNQFENLRKLMVKDVGFKKNNKFDSFIEDNMSTKNQEVLTVESLKIHQHSTGNLLEINQSTLPKSKVVAQNIQKETIVGMLKRAFS